MPRRKELTAYPEEYFRAIERAHDDGEFIIPCPTHKDAEAVRAQLYVFRDVLRSENHHLAGVADKLSFNIDGTKLILRVPQAIGVGELREALNEQT